MSHKKKFTFSQKAAWMGHKQTESYKAAEAAPLPHKEKRTAEMAQIANFIRLNGVTKTRLKATEPLQANRLV